MADLFLFYGGIAYGQEERRGLSRSVSFACYPRGTEKARRRERAFDEHPRKAAYQRLSRKCAEIGVKEARHETLEKVVQLRNQLTEIPAGDHEETLKVSNQITDSLKTIFALSENYPDLKANQNFLSLQEELTNTENKIAYSRQLYNSSAAQYDQKLLTFPSNIVAKIHHFTKVDYLETPKEEKEAPKVKF